MIPGLQARPYTAEELVVAFQMMDVDRRGYLVADDMRRVLDLCGHSEPTSAEVAEMLRLMDYNGSGEVNGDEFSSFFTKPPALFRNYDLARRDTVDIDFDEEEAGEAEAESGAQHAQPASPTAGRERSGSTSTPAPAPPDPRKLAVQTITQGKKALTPKFIKRVYSNFVDIDAEDYGFVTYEAFCLVLRKVESPGMRQAFEIFDVDRLGELDLRQFVVSLSMFTESGMQDKLKFAFMMYDDDQEGSISRPILLELLKAMAPYQHERERLKHANRLYAMNDLYPDMRVHLNAFINYIGQYAEDLVPESSSTTTTDQGRSGSGPPLMSGSSGSTPFGSTPSGHTPLASGSTPMGSESRTPLGSSRLPSSSS